jgi:putative membrane protein
MNAILNFLAAHDDWIKALHVISVIAWMAGLLYLPRLFVYHCEVEAGSAEDRRFQRMERRLLRAIMNPAMIATYIFGICLAATPGVVGPSAGWFQAKLVGVLVLTAMHGLMARWRKGFVEGRNAHPARFYRLMNEIPTLAMIAIVILAVVKPF